MSKDPKDLDNNTADDDVVFEEEALETDDIDLRGQVKKLRERLRQSESERQEYLAGWQRSKADYINLKKTEEAARRDLLKYAKEDLLHELLILADSFDMAMANREAWEEVPENWRRGVEYIYSQLTAIFSHNGLTVINPQGEMFDPVRHHSVAAEAVNKKEEDGLVTEVVKKGYELDGKVIRPAQVKVGHFEG